MTVKCPQCGFDVVVKASIGEGTQSMRGAKKLSKNDLYIFKEKERLEKYEITTEALHSD